MGFMVKFSITVDMGVSVLAVIFEQSLKPPLVIDTSEIRYVQIKSKFLIFESDSISYFLGFFDQKYYLPRLLLTMVDSGMIVPASGTSYHFIAEPSFIPSTIFNNELKLQDVLQERYMQIGEDIGSVSRDYLKFGALFFHGAYMRKFKRLQASAPRSPPSFRDTVIRWLRSYVKSDSLSETELRKVLEMEKSDLTQEQKNGLKTIPQDASRQSSKNLNWSEDLKQMCADICTISVLRGDHEYIQGDFDLVASIALKLLGQKDIFTVLYYSFVALSDNPDLITLKLYSCMEYYSQYCLKKYQKACPAIYCWFKAMKITNFIWITNDIVSQFTRKYADNPWPILMFLHQCGSYRQRLGDVFASMTFLRLPEFLENNIMYETDVLGFWDSEDDLPKPSSLIRLASYFSTLEE